MDQAQRQAIRDRINEHARQGGLLIEGPTPLDRMLNPATKGRPSQQIYVTAALGQIDLKAKPQKTPKPKKQKVVKKFSSEEIKEKYANAASLSIQLMAALEDTGVEDTTTNKL